MYFAIKMHRMDNFKTIKIINSKPDPALSDQCKLLNMRKENSNALSVHRYKLIIVFISGRPIIYLMSTQQLVIPSSGSISYKITGVYHLL
jgi:hypothetical protein